MEQKFFNGFRFIPTYAIKPLLYSLYFLASRLGRAFRSTRATGNEPKHLIPQPYLSIDPCLLARHNQYLILRQGLSHQQVMKSVF